MKISILNCLIFSVSALLSLFALLLHFDNNIGKLNLLTNREWNMKVLVTWIANGNKYLNLQVINNDQVSWHSDSQSRRRAIEVPFTGESVKGIKNLFSKADKQSSSHSTNDVSNNSKRGSRRRNKKQKRMKDPIDSDSSTDNPDYEESESASDTSDASTWIPGRKGHFLRGERKSEETLVIAVSEPKEKTRLDESVNDNDQKQISIYSVDQASSTVNDGKIQVFSAVLNEANSGLTSKTITIDELKQAFKENKLHNIYPYPPWLPYHIPQQSTHSENLDRLYVPNVRSVAATRKAAQSLLDIASLNDLPPAWRETIEKPLPDMKKQRASFEPENLKLHLCNGVFEAYSASYLTTKAHMIEVKSEGYNLTWVNCEMASFIHMRESNNFYKNPDGVGMIMQSLDVLDFSVIHLSTFERSSKKYKHRLWKTKQDMKTQWSKIGPVEKTAKLLENKFNPNITGKYPRWSKEANRTLVVMPFLGGAMGAGHSELGNRFHYLRACFWSFYEFVPHIMMGVSRQEDVEWGWKYSGLPFYDIILLDNLPKGAGLPVGTTQQVKKRLVDGRYDFDYIFFTESDQILISRQLQVMYDHLKRYPSRMILPHRLMVYSDRIMVEVHNKSYQHLPASSRPTEAISITPTVNENNPTYEKLLAPENAWMHQSCCMPRQNCVERKSWVPLSHETVPVINYYGLYVPLGNVNFLAESYRACKITSYMSDYCP